VRLNYTRPEGSLRIHSLSHGEGASIERVGDEWVIDPTGRAERIRLERATGVQLELFS